MRRVVLLLFCSLAASAQTPKPEQLPSLYGAVLNAVNGGPVSRASLTLTRLNPPAGTDGWTQSYGALADAAGKFAIPNIQPGKYRLRAARSGFLALEYGARGPEGTGAVLDLQPGEALKDIELRLTPHGVIAGRILDAAGEPLQGAQVQLLSSRYVDGKKTLATKSVAYTNDLGEYRWSGLTAGKYYIYAMDFGLPGAGLPPSSLVKEDYVPLYYPGTPDASGAAPLDVLPGAQAQAADMMLRTGRTASVKGRVVIDLPNARGLPSVRFTRRIDHDNSASGTFRTPAARVNDRGEFEIRTLTPGVYDAMAEIGVGGRSFVGLSTIQVTEADLEGLVLTIGNGATLSGRVAVEGGAKQELRSLQIRLRRGGPAVGSIRFRSGERVAENGTFKIENLQPDRYGLMLEGLPDGFYVKTIRSGEADAMYSGVDLTSGTSAQVEIALSPKAGVVSGVVQNSNSNQAVAGATAVLIPKEAKRLPIPAFYHAVTADQHGRFRFANVAPGEYKVFAWEEVEFTAWMDPDFMKAFDGKDQSATISEGASVSVQVNVIPVASDQTAK